MSKYVNEIEYYKIGFENMKNIFEKKLKINQKRKFEKFFQIYNFEKR